VPLKEFTIGKNDSGQRLDRFVSKIVPSLPPALAQKYIRIKRIKVGGKGSKRDYKLSLGDTVQMYVNDEFFSAREPARLKFSAPTIDIVYEDENIMLVNKEAGVLCHSDGGYSYADLLSQIQAHLHIQGHWRSQDENSFAPALCNRIDRNTSGIVIAAKNAEALRIMGEKIKLREIDKHYLAIAHGTPAPPEGELTGYIFKDAVKNQVYVTVKPSPGAKFAAMRYKTLASANGMTLLECELITGRTHQIRAQLAAMGHPLLGDGKYGSERLNKPFGERRQALCSYKLAFAFKSDAGALQYLNNKTFQISDVPFVQKYFNSIAIDI